MDALYGIKLDHLIIDSRIENKIFPKSKEKMRTSIINCNIIIATLFRCDGIYLYNKQKDDIDLDIKDKLRFTKGYSICIHYETVDKMKIYEYYRKTISHNKTTIKVKENNVKVKEYLKNKNYSEPIWVKNDNIAQIDNDKLKI
jgi:hypothetical protein